jgi:hypothetical protein
VLDCTLKVVKQVYKNKRMFNFLYPFVKNLGGGRGGGEKILSRNYEYFKERMT